MGTIGLSKTIFNSAVCRMKDYEDVEIFLTERLTRKKANGAWPQLALQWMMKDKDFVDGASYIAENRDLDEPLLNERVLNSRLPFAEFLASEKMQSFSQLTNPNLQFLTHHLCHAYSAAYVSPFDQTLILVIDGAGSRARLFSSNHAEFMFADNQDSNSAEERTLYTFNKGKLVCVDKQWQSFKKSEKIPGHSFSEGLGSFYEKAAEYIFNSKRAAGKVMGLAPYGKASQEIQSPTEYLEGLDWRRAFQGSSKNDWQKSDLPHFQNVAADVQKYFEKNLITYLEETHRKFPEYKNLILVGGCALNCTTNMKIFMKGLFEQIYVPPFPSDEGISLGVSYAQHYAATGEWRRKPHEEQVAYFGPYDSSPEEGKVREIFQGFEILQPDSISHFCAEVLAAGLVVAWFQGRSESGPRALGNRSILVRPDLSGAKRYLNDNIKFREEFRPYGCSVLWEKASDYFDIPLGFENPFMSFAVNTRPQHMKSLGEVTHVDGTSRMQTVHQSQNPRFYELIQIFGEMTGIHCLLNTSLNVMGEPIVETLADAKNFLEKTPVDGIAVGDFYVRRRNL